MSSFMDFMNDYIFGPLNVLDRGEGMIKRLIYRDTAVKFSILKIAKGGTHTRADVQAILDRYGVATFGHTHDGTCQHFLVKNRQAVWAEYLLLQSGVDLQNSPIDPKNYGYPSQHPDGWMPTPWSEQHRDADSPNQPHKESFDNREKSISINSQIDRIMDWLDSV